MKISEIIADKYKLRIPPTVYYDLLADVQEAEEPTTKNDCAEQNGCITCSLDDGDDCCRKLYEESMQEPTTKNDLGVDCISRADAIGCLAGQIELSPSNVASVHEYLKCVNKRLHDLPSVTPQPCEDAISRQALLNATVNKNSIWNKITDSKGDNLETIISKLPSVTPQPRKGHWIFDGDCLICSKCKKAYTFSGSDFCPSCGADMREVEE